MSALPRPDIAPGPHRDLNDALHDLHHRAGWPSLRALAREAGVSHTTVSKTFSSPALPTWGNVELLVEAMHGDTVRFHHLWLAASSPASTNGTHRTVEIAGRRDELTAVRRHLDRGTGLLLVTGEAGMGKTTLVEAAAGAAHGFVASGHCLPLSTEVPLLPVAEILRSVHDADGGQWIEEAMSACDAFVPASLCRLLPEVARLATVTDPDDDWSRQRLFTAVTATLTALLERQPVAFLFEDLHWADAATLDLLEQVLSRGLALPVVGTWRLDDPETADSTDAWCHRVRRLTGTTTLDLEPLTLDETTQQLGLLGSTNLAPELVARIHHRSRGQPLFTEQLAADLSPGADLPRLLADVLDRRLVGLGPAAWAAARTLAVADRPLPHPLLGDATGLHQEDLTTGLHELDSRRLLGRATAPEDVALRHPLMAEAIRRRLVPTEAATAHGRIAAALSETTEPSAAEIATHWRQALEPAHELDWRIRAARDAHHRHAPLEEAEQWKRSIALWPTGHDAAGSPTLSKIDVLLALLDALDDSGQIEATTDPIEQALALAPTLRPPVLAEVHRRHAYILAALEDPEAGLVASNRAIEIHASLPPSPEYTRAVLGKATLLRRLGRLREASDLAARAHAVAAETGDFAGVRRSLAILAWHQGMDGDLTGGLKTMVRARSTAAPTPDVWGDLLVGVLHTSLLLCDAARAAQVLSAAEEALATIEAWDVRNHTAAWLVANVSEALRAEGLAARAAELIDPSTAGAFVMDMWPVHMERASIDVVRGRIVDAIARHAVIASVAALPPAHRPAVASSLATAHLWGGAPELALESLAAALDETAETDYATEAGAALVLAARASADLAAGGPATRRAHLASQLRDWHARMIVDPFGPGAVPVARTAYAATWIGENARIDGTDTVDHWVSAATGWDRLTRPHDAAYCRWRGAQVAVTTGRAATAQKLLRRAARDSREHVPLSAAIRATAEGRA